MELNIRQASKADIFFVYQLWAETNDWITSIGEQMWFTEDINIEAVEGYINRGVLYVAEIQNAICGTLAYEIEDPIFWPEIPAGQSAYVHRLVCSRSFAGKGVSSAMLDWAVNKAKQEDRRDLRLDTDAKRKKLMEVYERYGFKLVAIRRILDFLESALYVYPLTKNTV